MWTMGTMGAMPARRLKGFLRSDEGQLSSIRLPSAGGPGVSGTA